MIAIHDVLICWRVAASRDGTVLLWDVPTQTTIGTLLDTASCVHDCCVDVHASTATDVAGSVPFPLVESLLVLISDPREVSTENKLVVAAVDNSTVTAVDIRSRTPVVWRKLSVVFGNICCRCLRCLALPLRAVVRREVTAC